MNSNLRDNSGNVKDDVSFKDHHRKLNVHTLQNTRPLTTMVPRDNTLLLEIKQAHDFLRIFVLISQCEGLYV